MIDKFFLWQNAFLFLLDLCLISILGSYVVDKAQRGLWRTASSNAGTALLVYFFGMAWVRGSLLLWRHGFIGGGSESKGDIPLFLIGTIIAVVGAVCILRLFAEYAWRRIAFAYLWCVIGATLLAIAMTVY